jgi:hypothetical protein
MTLVNPYRHGAYYFTIAALLSMGVNKAHKFPAFAVRLAKVWQKADAEGWRDFKNRKARNEATAKDVGGRIFQNCRVLQRPDYGKPLLKAGAVLDLTRDAKGGLMVCLNTKSKRPQKPGRAPKLAAKPARASKKPSKNNKSTGGRSVDAGKPIQSEAAASEAVKAVTEVPAKA